ncbi:hypothetical protein [Mariniplasma anaerobium]|nr:hypothetical protein [Mariniplasma anaerobium]
MNHLFNKSNGLNHKQKHMCTCLTTVNYVRYSIQDMNNLMMD